MKKHQIQIDEKGRPYTKIGPYRIVKESKSFTGIYEYSTLITSKTGWRQAIKIAKLLHQAYQDGYDDAKEIYM
jgi:hypothetical protein